MVITDCYEKRFGVRESHAVTNEEMLITCQQLVQYFSDERHKLFLARQRAAGIKLYQYKECA